MTQIKVKIVEPVLSIKEMFLREGFEILPLLDDKVPDLVCFTGGADVNPELYKEKKLGISNIDPKRDERDFNQFVKYEKIPKVGICRGGQFLNVISGGSMWQHVTNHATSNGHKLHNLLHIPGHLEQDIIQVSSTHHQMMRVGDNGEVIAIAYNENKNGEISSLSNIFLSASEKSNYPEYDTEVVWYNDTKSLCYQPHPEFGIKTQNSKYFFDLIKYFFFI